MADIFSGMYKGYEFGKGVVEDYQAKQALSDAYSQTQDPSEALAIASKNLGAKGYGKQAEELSKQAFERRQQTYKTKLMEAEETELPYQTEADIAELKGKKSKSEIEADEAKKVHEGKEKSYQILQGLPSDEKPESGQAAGQAPGAKLSETVSSGPTVDSVFDKNRELVSLNNQLASEEKTLQTEKKAAYALYDPTSRNAAIANLDKIQTRIDDLKVKVLNAKKEAYGGEALMLSRIDSQKSLDGARAALAETIGAEVDKQNPNLTVSDRNRMVQQKVDSLLPTKYDEKGKAQISQRLGDRLGAREVAALEAEKLKTQQLKIQADKEIQMANRQLKSLESQTSALAIKETGELLSSLRSRQGQLRDQRRAINEELKRLDNEYINTSKKEEKAQIDEYRKGYREQDKALAEQENQLGFMTDTISKKLAKNLNIDLEEPKPPKAASTGGTDAIISRAKADPKMKGNTFGKNVEGKGVEVFDPKGKLIGYYN